MFTFFTDKDENEKTISQSSALRGEEIGENKETVRKRKMDMRRREQVLTNNIMPTNMVLKLFVIYIYIFFWPSKVLNCTYVGKRNPNFLGGEFLSQSAPESR